MNIFDKIALKTYKKELEEAKIVYKALPRDVKMDIIMDVYNTMDTSGWEYDKPMQYKFIPQISSQHKEVLDNAVMVLTFALNKNKSKGESVLSRRLGIDKASVEDLVQKVYKRLNVSENGLFFNTVDFYKKHNAEITTEAKLEKKMFWANKTPKSIKWLKNEIDEYLVYSKKSGEEAEKERENINSSLNEVGAYSSLKIIKILRHLYYNNSATQTILEKYPEDARKVDRQSVYKLANGRSVNCFVREDERSM